MQFKAVLERSRVHAKKDQCQEISDWDPSDGLLEQQTAPYLKGCIVMATDALKTREQLPRKEDIMTWTTECHESIELDLDQRIRLVIKWPRPIYSWDAKYAGAIYTNPYPEYNLYKTWDGIQPTLPIIGKFFRLNCSYENACYWLYSTLVVRIQGWSN